MTFNVSELTALEILDSRARPTLAVTVRLADGSTARAGVPSGASTGSREAVELRDGDKSRFGGSGVLKAVGNVNGELADLLRGRSWASLAEADQAMIDLDGTPTPAALLGAGLEESPGHDPDAACWGSGGQLEPIGPATVGAGQPGRLLCLRPTS